MISWLVLKWRNGKCFAIRRGYKAILPASSKFYLTERVDQAQNFLDLLAARAYGVRWDLLPWDPLDTIK